MVAQLNELVGNHHLVEALWQSVNTSSGSLVNVAPLIKRILLTGAWKRRQIPQLNGEIVEFDSFLKFITEPPLRGCGWTPETVEPLIKDDAETLTEWRKATTAPVGTNQSTMVGHYNVITRQGNSRSYTLDRLGRERPDLFKKVVDKEMSANAAAIKAGFRKKLKHGPCPKCGYEW